MRKRSPLDPLYVTALCHGPSPADFRAAVEPTGRCIQGKPVRRYPYGVVMPEGDRNLHAIYMYERPDAKLVRDYMREVALAVKHLHENGIVHEDVKLLNVIRMEGRLCLIDLDAAADLDRGDFAGGKFSSGVVPPEMFYKLESKEEEAQYQQYWGHIDRHSPEWAKLRPVDTGHGVYVVRAWRRLVSVGAGDDNSTNTSTYANVHADADTVGCQKSSPPYALRAAAYTHDVWALGVMLFQLLFGESLVAVNRDDDLAGPSAVLRAATWTDKEIVERIERCQGLLEEANTVSSTVAVDLLVKLLKVDPSERFQCVEDILFHPFLFHPHVTHSMESTPFIELATAMEMTPLALVPAIVSSQWRFNKLDAQLSTENVSGTASGSVLNKQSSHPVLAVQELYSLTEAILTEKVHRALSLPVDVKSHLWERVRDEAGRFTAVQLSILTNLVIKVDEANVHRFNEFFPLVKDAVALQFPSKPRQSTGEPVLLYMQATTAKPHYEKVLCKNYDCLFLCPISTLFLSFFFLSCVNLDFFLPSCLPSSLNPGMAIGDSSLCCGKSSREIMHRTSGCEKLSQSMRKGGS